jgi:DNA-binding PadR family transcriptional regulator
MNKSDLVVLGFLRSKPMYGYEIIQWLKHHHLDSWAEIKMPSIYKALQRLENSGHIVGEKMVEGNNPPKIVYQNTKKGNNYFIELIHYYANIEINPKDFWLAVSFMDKGFSREDFLNIIEKRKVRIKEHKEYHSRKHDQLKKHKDWQDIPFFIRTLMELGQKFHETDLNALDKLIAEAEKPENMKFFIREEEK